MGSLESLNLDRKRSSLVSGDLLGPAGACPAELLQVEAPLSQVPALVTTCCNHLLHHGLHTVGIFRVSSSKKRVRQLREEFDQGGEVLLTEEHCPHDVATLLKEFFRDLPEPLLTRELYEPFLSTQKIRNRRLKQEATQHLLQLLPAPNRDTLWALLTFLSTVAEHARDQGDTIPGNMMDSTNLATMFAPNILHTHRAGEDSVSAASLAAIADERTDCTNVVRSMIDYNKELFEVSAELLDETYHHLMDTHAEALDVMLRRRSAPHEELSSQGQQVLHQLLASLLQQQQPQGIFPAPSSPPGPASPPYSLTNAGLEGDVESCSSVFEGSECSVSLPRSPTEHQDFDRLVAGADGSSALLLCRETRGKGSADEVRSGAGEVSSDDRGWFRRRDKSSSRELERGGGGVEEKPAERSRWFRRRDKTSPRGSVDYGIRGKGSGKKKSEKTSRRDDGTHHEQMEARRESCDSRQRSSSDQAAARERLRVPDHGSRRLSSPEIDACGVITASLKIPMLLQQQQQQQQQQTQQQQHLKQPCVLSSFSKDSNIPYIEDPVLAEEARTRWRETSVSSRQRTGSSDSYLGQPITGTISFQPLCKRDGDKQSHDSVLSSSSADMFTFSPSPRNTPISDAMFASEVSSIMSRATSPPDATSPDSGTPGLSPPTSPPPLLPRRARRIEPPSSSRVVPLTHSSSHTFSSKSVVTTTITKGTGERRGSHVVELIPLTRSRTAEVPSSSILDADRSAGIRMGNPDTRSSTSAKVTVTVGDIDKYGGESSGGKGGGGGRSAGSSSGGDGLRHYTRRRTTALRQKEGTTDTQEPQHQYAALPLLPAQPHRLQQTVEGTSTQLWKRCEIIASETSEPETLV